MNILIYKLIDPRTNEIRYVGKTKKSLTKRLYEHLTKRNLTPKTHKNHWIKQLLNEKLKPKIELIEITDQNNWIEREIFHIKKLRSEGTYLTNLTDGGDGALGSKQSKESIQKRIDTIKERYGNLAFKLSDETKNNIRIAHLGKKQSQERKDKTSINLRKTLFQYDLNNNLIKEWHGVRKCAKTLNIDYTTLRVYIKSQKPLNGFIWKYQ